MGDVVGFPLRVQRCRSGLLDRRRGLGTGTFGCASRDRRRSTRVKRQGDFAPQIRHMLDAKRGFVG